MAKKVKHDDGRAIDLLLNGELTARAIGQSGNAGKRGNGKRGNGGHGEADDGSAAVVSRGHGNFGSRLQSVERVLRLLDELPTADPPPDLVSKTLRRIDQDQAAPGTAAARERAAQHPFLGGAGTHPHA